jgi:hypothetical protein
MTQPHILKTLLERDGHPDLLLLALYIQHTQGWAEPELWEPRSPFVPAIYRDSRGDYDADKHERIKAAREAKRGTAEHTQAQRKVQQEHRKYVR